MRFSISDRCDEVTRALAAPGELSPDVVAEHLAACPRCAAWSERDAALTRLWDATRPADPGPAAWDAVWARVADRLDAAPEAETRPVPDVVPLPSRFRLGVYAFIAAQAAAILVALTLGVSRYRPSGGPLPGSSDPGLLARASAVEIEAGEVVMIREDGKGLRSVALTLDDRSNTLDGYYTMLNVFEAMAE